MRFNIGLFFMGEDTDSRALKRMKSGHTMERHIQENLNLKKIQFWKFQISYKAAVFIIMAFR